MASMSDSMSPSGVSVFDKIPTSVFSICGAEPYALGTLCVRVETRFRRSCAREDSNPQPSDP
jgi:hypothetical protein